jgi:hypothetical protein
MQQKDFIVPPGWPFIQRKFKCRTRVSPFPFGFPSYLPERQVFKQVISRPSIACMTYVYRRVTAKSFYITRYESPLYSPLSMKKPRRFLHRDVSESELRGFYFCSKPEINLKIEQIPVPNDLPHHWETETDRSVDCSESFSCLANTADSAAAFLTKKPHEPVEFAHRAVGRQDHFKMPGISTYLLRARKFRLSACKSNEEKVNFAVRQSHFSLSHDRLEQDKGMTPEPNMLFRFKKASVEFFAQSFAAPGLESAGIFPCYNGRFRVFRFPYKPDTRTVTPEKALYPEVGEPADYLENSFGDELRTREFRFSFPAISQTAMQSFRITGECAGAARPHRFVNNLASDKIDYLTSKRMLSCQPVCSLAIFSVWINNNRFYKPVYAGSFRLKKVVKSGPQSYMHSRLPDRLSIFQASGQRRTGFTGMDMNGCHWVIMPGSQKKQKQTLTIDKGYFSPTIHSDAQTAFSFIR